MFVRLKTGCVRAKILTGQLDEGQPQNYFKTCSVATEEQVPSNNLNFQCWEK